MGVSNLEQFVERRARAAFFPVDIKRFADKARERQSYPPPTIIVDLCACERSFYGNLDSICGGQGLDYIRNLEVILSAFKNAGIRLIFVKDGAALDKKSKTTLARKYHKLPLVKKLLEQLKNGELPQSISHKYSQTNHRNKIESNIILPNTICDELLTQLFQQQVIYSGKDKDADKLVAQLASDPSLNVFGILSQDTDFLIYQYPRHVHYFSATHFDFELLFSNGYSLKTFEYSRIGLAEHLGLKVEHLPLLATLKGNDIIDKFELAQFHNKLIGQWPNDRVIAHLAIEGVAGYIIDEGLMGASNIGKKSSKLIAKKIFGDVKRSVDIKESISDYFLLDFDQNQNNVIASNYLSNEDPEWSRLLKLFPTNGPIHCLMMGETLSTPTLYEDYSDTDDLPTMAIATEQFRRRFYGVLLYEKPGALRDPHRDEFELRVPEKCMTGPGSIDSISMQTIEMPPKNVYPGLEQLVKGDDESLTAIRWKIFSYIVSPSLDPDDLKTLDQNFLYLVCQLRMLQDDWRAPVLFDWEVRVFLLHHLRLHEEELPQFRLPKARGIHLATLYTSGFLPHAASLTPRIFNGQEKFFPMKNFNGILFQSLYSECSESQSVVSVATIDEMELMEKYFNIITSSGARVRDIFV